MINLSAQADSLRVTGREFLRVYRAEKAVDGSTISSEHERSFCSHCGSHLWAFHPSWPKLLHPLASAIDTELPVPRESVHMMLDSKASWVEAQVDERDQCFSAYPKESIKDFHDSRGWTVR